MNKDNSLYKEDIRNALSVKGIEGLRGKKILITGASGLIGVHLTDALMLLGDVKIYAVGRNMEQAVSRLGGYFNNPFFDFIQQDVCDPFPENLSVDYILPLASNTHPLVYSRFPIETMMTNLKGAENALDLANRCGAVVLYPSSVEVYGDANGRESFTEHSNGVLDISTARACYTESKRSCEALCLSYFAEKNVKVKIVRLSRVFGPTMLESDSKASSQFIQRALAGEDIILKSDGNQFFSYTYVTDAVSAILHVMLNGKTGVSYNISNPKCDVCLKDFAETCARYCGRKVVYDIPSEIERKGFSTANTAILNNSRLVDSGWSPKYSFEDAVRRTIDILND